MHLKTFEERDIVVLMARSSFDAHIGDSLSTLSSGGTLIILHPKGNLDFDYLAKTIRDKAISCMPCVPSLLEAFFRFVQDYNRCNDVSSLRSILSGGE